MLVLSLRDGDIVGEIRAEVEFMLGSMLVIDVRSGQWIKCTDIFSAQTHEFGSKANQQTYCDVVIGEWYLARTFGGELRNRICLWLRSPWRVGKEEQTLEANDAFAKCFRATFQVEGRLRRGVVYQCRGLSLPSARCSAALGRRDATPDCGSSRRHHGRQRYPS